MDKKVLMAVIISYGFVKLYGGYKFNEGKKSAEDVYCKFMLNKEK